jgi:hypothetical protein
MEPANARRLHVAKLCKQYRDKDSTNPIDVNPQVFHGWLNNERYNDGTVDDDGNPNLTPLYPGEIATIVNYCYYRGDPSTIARIMGRPSY